jgi:hypothetical protein
MFLLFHPADPMLPEIPEIPEIPGREQFNRPGARVSIASYGSLFDAADARDYTDRH